MRAVSFAHLLVAMAALIAVGCTTSEAPPPARRPVVPFVAIDAGPVPPWQQAPAYVNTAAPAGTPSCRPSQVALLAEPLPDDGGFRYRLTVTTTSRTDCAIGGARIAVDVIDNTGRPRLRGQPSTKPSTRLPLRSGGQLYEFVRWRSACAMPAQVRIRLRVLTSPEVAVVSRPVKTPPCLPQGTTGTNPLPFVAVVYEPPREEPKPWHVLTVDLDEKTLRTVAGVAHYEVALRNSTASPVALDPCPVYTTGIGESATGVSIRYRLNCAQAPAAVPARGEVRFAIELPLDPREFRRRDPVVELEPDQDYQGFTMGFSLETQRGPNHGDSFPVKVVDR